MTAPETARRQWLALRVKSRCEKVVAAAVRLKGFEEFLPLYTSRRAWSDRSQRVELPVFPGYVFCRLIPAERMPLLTIPGVLHFVETGKVPLPIDDAEIAAIQLTLHSNIEIEPCSFEGNGVRVRLQSGPLAGLEAFPLPGRGRGRVAIAITVLSRYVALDLEPEWLGSSAHFLTQEA